MKNNVKKEWKKKRESKERRKEWIKNIFAGMQHRVIS